MLSFPTIPGTWLKHGLLFRFASLHNLAGYTPQSFWSAVAISKQYNSTVHNAIGRSKNTDVWRREDMVQLKQTQFQQKFNYKTFTSAFELQWQKLA